MYKLNQIQVRMGLLVKFRFRVDPILTITSNALAVLEIVRDGPAQSPVMELPIGVNRQIVCEKGLLCADPPL